MPKVGGKKYSYTKTGMKQAAAARKKQAAKKPVRRKRGR